MQKFLVKCSIVSWYKFEGSRGGIPQFQNSKLEKCLKMKLEDSSNSSKWDLEHIREVYHCFVCYIFQFFPVQKQESQKSHNGVMIVLHEDRYFLNYLTIRILTKLFLVSPF